MLIFVSSATPLSEDVSPRAPQDSARDAARSARAPVTTRAAQIGLVVLGTFAALLLLAVVERIVYRGDVLPGVTVAGRSEDGRSEQAVLADIDARADAMEHRVVTARAGAVTLTATARDIGLTVDRLATLRAARRAGRSRNPISDASGLVLRRVRADTIPLVVSYRTSALAALLDRWQIASSRGVRSADVVVKGDAVEVVAPQRGRGIDVDRARDLVRAAFLAAHAPAVVDLPITDVDPPISRSEAERVATVARRVVGRDYTVHSAGHDFTVTGEQAGTALVTHAVGHRLDLLVDPVRLQHAIAPQLAPIGSPPVPASFRVNGNQTVSVVPSRDGQQPDLTVIGRGILRGDTDIVAPLGPSHPAHDTAWANRLGITELVSSFTTHHPCCAPRVTNIHRGADIIRGTVLEPGQVFSLNDIVGARTLAKGFVVAPVYYEDFTEDVGGGISQLATTTFNAAWWGGFEIVEHHPHTIYFDRYPLGREATVNYPYLDLKFRNDSHHGVLVWTSYSDTSITVSLYGDTEGRAVHEVWGGCRVGPVYDTANDPRCMHVISTTPITNQLLTCPVKKATDDPTNKCATLAVGEQYLSQAGHTGYVVEFEREITRPGAAPVVQHYSWRYTMLPNVYLVGSAATAPTTTAAPGATTTTKPGAATTTTSAP
jgi:hypothetical protein